MPASLSTEGKIITGLAALHMSRKELVGICKALSIPVSEALLSLALSGKRTLSQWTGMAVLGVIQELVALQAHHGVQMSWASSEDVATLLVQRRMSATEEMQASLGVTG